MTHLLHPDQVRSGVSHGRNRWRDSRHRRYGDCFHERLGVVVSRALEELRIEGVKTTVEFHRKMMKNSDFTEGRLWTGFLEKK